jgi:hypothetical protein
MLSVLLRCGDGAVIRTFRPRETGMEATMETSPARTHKDCKSRPGALVWFFRKSRDGWKHKYQELKSTVKGYKNRIADLTKSRELWRLKAEQAGEQLVTLQAEIVALRAQITAEDEKKSGRGTRSTQAHSG